ncbi:MAG: PASTA domain-containing protein [Acidobacteria bacterium]|nr:MAG: PASTA domain-containing protein [Acidobacteriota bacterium]
MVRDKRRKGSLSAARPVGAKRGVLLAGIFMVWMLAIILRLYDLQIIQYVQLLARADRQQQRTVEIAPKRGIIYDRKMHPLAMSLAVDSVYAVPSNIPDSSMEAKLLAPILNLDAKDLGARFKPHSSFCWVKRKITPQQSDRIRDLNLQGIYFQKEMKRFYPDGDLAATVLGYVGMDDNGLGGVEYQFNKQIRGVPGKVLLSTDAKHRSFRSTEWRGEPGKNLFLTIDDDIQYIAERSLALTVAKYHAAGGTVIVQNPSNGEILAMANQPTFNPNDYQKFPATDRINRAVSWIYEPGSTFKSVTISSAIDEKLARPSELVDCQMGQISLGGRIIHDDAEAIRHERGGPLTLNQVLMYSSDVGSVKMALRLGEERFYRRILNYGFDADTGIGLPGEEEGLLAPPRRWSGVSIGQLAIGQGVGVTPLQMIRLYSAIANDGVMLQPKIVRDIGQVASDGSSLPILGRRIMSKQTADIMRQMLAGVVEHGTGVAAQLAGYTSAGKTGTAQKVDATGHYSHKEHIASFMGFAPVDKPAVAILVVIDTPVGAMYGAEVAAPTWKSIAEQTLRYLNVPQDKPSDNIQIASRRSAEFPGQKRRGNADNPPINSESVGAATRPVEPVSYSSEPDTHLKDTVVLDESPTVAVPDFTGLSARRATQECQSLGLEMQMAGSGLAVQQDPPAGATVHAGSRVWVRFAQQVCCSVSERVH